MNPNSLARDGVFATITQDQVDRIERGAWYHSIALPDGRIIKGIIPVEALEQRLAHYELPADLTGLRVLDVGAATGWCSFEMERRGASVVAVDCVEYEDFRTAHKLIGSAVDYQLMDVDEMTPARLGQFDIVVFFGVLYHLRHPLLGLEKILALAKDTVLVESFASDAHLPEAEWRANGCSMEFYESDELGGQVDNWVGPTVNCLLALCRAAGFVRVEFKYVENRRAGVLCHRKWEPEPAVEAACDPTPVISSAVNNRTGDVAFGQGKDEYICVYFRVDKEGVRREDVRVEIDGYGAPVLTLSHHAESGSMQANLRLPAYLEPGVHQVRVRLAGGRFSETREIRVSAAGAQTERPAPPAQAPKIYRASNGLSDSTEFRGDRREYLRCCFELEATTPLESGDILVEVGGVELRPFFVGRDVEGERASGAGNWQANVKLPANMEPGRRGVRVRTVTGAWSSALEISISC